MPTREEFKAALLQFAKRAMQVKEHCKNEESAKMFLVLPFIGLLGYDDRNPLEVTPEHEADFAEKYKNRADYAIMFAEVPTIAVECKAIGNAKKDDRGQLKRYFNAVKTTKLAILTDGIRYEFYVDSIEPNMMDDEPFLVVDLDTVATEQVSDALIEHLLALTKGAFDPAAVGENARLSLAYQSIHGYLAAQFSAPGEEFTRFVLSAVGIKNVRKATFEAYREITGVAFGDVFKSHLLNRLDIADGRGRLPPVSPSEAPSPSMVSAPAAAKSEAEIVTTAAELEAYEDIRRRLAFLVAGDAVLFESIGRVAYRDYQGKFIVFYDKERKGRLVDVVEGRDGSLKFIVGDGLPDPETRELATLDERLLALFRRRVSEV